MTGLDKDIFRAIRNLTTLLNEAYSHWNYLCPYLEKLDGAANRALEGYAKDYPEDVKTLIAEKPAQPRQCDVGTPDEQERRYFAFCDIYPNCDGCPHAEIDECALAWAQMPYEEERSVR